MRSIVRRAEDPLEDRPRNPHRGTSRVVLELNSLISNSNVHTKAVAHVLGQTKRKQGLEKWFLLAPPFRCRPCHHQRSSHFQSIIARRRAVETAWISYAAFQGQHETAGQLSIARHRHVCTRLFHLWEVDRTGVGSYHLRTHHCLSHIHHSTIGHVGFDFQNSPSLLRSLDCMGRIDRRIDALVAVDTLYLGARLAESDLGSGDRRVDSSHSRLPKFPVVGYSRLLVDNHIHLRSIDLVADVAIHSHCDPEDQIDFLDGLLDRADLAGVGKTDFAAHHIDRIGEIVDDVAVGVAETDRVDCDPDTIELHIAANLDRNCRFHTENHSDQTDCTDFASVHVGSYSIGGGIVVVDHVIVVGHSGTPGHLHIVHIHTETDPHSSVHKTQLVFDGFVGVDSWKIAIESAFENFLLHVVHLDCILIRRADWRDGCLFYLADRTIDPDNAAVVRIERRHLVADSDLLVVMLDLL